MEASLLVALAGQGQGQLFAKVHAPAVVLHHGDEPLAAASSRVTCTRVGAGVQAVFQQLLDDAGRALYHLAGGYLILQLRRQDADGAVSVLRSRAGDPSGYLDRAPKPSVGHGSRVAAAAQTPGVRCH